MPNQNLSDEEIREYIAYFKWADANVRPQGTTQPQPAAPGTAECRRNAVRTSSKARARGRRSRRTQGQRGEGRSERACPRREPAMSAPRSRAVARGRARACRRRRLRRLHRGQDRGHLRSRSRDPRRGERHQVVVFASLDGFGDARASRARSPARPSNRVQRRRTRQRAHGSRAAGAVVRARPARADAGGGARADRQRRGSDARAQADPASRHSLSAMDVADAAARPGETRCLRRRDPQVRAAPSGFPAVLPARQHLRRAGDSRCGRRSTPAASAARYVRRDPLWHAHEMLFGYTMAVIVGFLLTAVRNWSGSADADRDAARLARCCSGLPVACWC